MGLLDFILFLLGFLILIKGADLLVKGASAIARRFHISDLVIGLTVVAFGTSTPELFVNIVASLKGNTAIAIGNVLGSNIANILLILGISALIYPLSVTKSTVWKEIPFSLLAATILGLMANDARIDGGVLSSLNRTDGLVLLCFFIIFLYYTHSIAKDIKGTADHIPSAPRDIFRSVANVSLGILGLTLGGKWIVEGAIQLALSLSISETLVGLTIVAVGTSLPELATSAMAAYRRNVEIAVGNIVGSNIFNIFFVLGTSATIQPLPLQSNSNLDILIGIMASLMLFFFMFTGKKRSLDRWEGFAFVCCYIGYVVFLIVNT